MSQISPKERNLSNGKAIPQKPRLTKTTRQATQAQALLAKNVDFSVEDLKQVFSTIADKGSYNVPSDDAIEQAFFYIKNLADWQRYKAQMAPRFERSERLKAAMNDVSELLPFFVDEVKYTIEQFGTAPPDVQAALAALEDVSKAINTLKGQSVLLRGKVSDADAPAWWEMPSWTELAPRIAKLFRSAMETTNPKVRFGNSSKGPVSTFVSSVLEITTGDSVKAETIFAFLKNNPCQ